MKKKLMITILFSFIAIVILAIVASYALFTIDITKNKNFKLAIGNLELSINDQGNSFTDGKIVVDNMIPVRDSIGMAQDGFTFTLSNTGTIDANYSIYLDDVVLSTLPTGTDGRLDNSLVRVNLTNITNSTSHTYTLSEISNRLLETGTLEVGDSNSYVLRMWLAYTAGNEAQNKYYATKVRVDSVQKNSVPITSNVPTIDSCPGCVYTYTTGPLYYSGTPTTLTSSQYQENYMDVVSETNKNYFLGLILNDSSTITKAYVCVIKDNVPFCLEGSTDGSSYLANKTLLNSLYGQYDSSTGLGCLDRESNVVCDSSISVYDDGGVLVTAGSDKCGVSKSGSVYCSE